MPRQVLVIGGSGFVGSALIPRLRAGGFRVCLLNRGSRPVPGTTQLVADRDDPAQLSDAAHALTSLHAVIDTSAYTRRQCESAWSILAPRTRHWIHLSSAGVYSERTKEPPTEHSPIGGAPVWGDYGKDKSEVDDFLLQRHEGPAITILRPPYLYGPGNNNERETYVWARVLQGKSILVPGDGETMVQFLHVDDLADAFVRLASRAAKGTSVYNIAAEPAMSLTEWAQAVAASCGAGAKLIRSAGAHAQDFQPRQYFPFRDFPCWVDTTNIRTALGWHPLYKFDAGIKQTLMSYDVRQLCAMDAFFGAEDQILTRMRNVGE